MLEIFVLIIVISSFTFWVYLNVMFLNAMKSIILAKILKNRMNKMLNQKTEKNENKVHDLDEWFKQNKEAGKDVRINSHRGGSSVGA